MDYRQIKMLAQKVYEQRELNNLHFNYIRSEQYKHLMLVDHLTIFEGDDDENLKNNLYGVYNFLKSLNIDQRIKDLAWECFCNYTKEYSAKDFKNNPYIKRIKFEDYHDGDITVSKEIIKKYELFPNQVHVDKGFLTMPNVGFMDEDYEYYYLKQGNIAWMSSAPSELITIDEHINLATGNVLNLGLGIGYYVYMAHLKDDVKKITVIESNDKIIKWFKNKILPQFDHPEKIEIIHQDAFLYLASLDEDCPYDVCFCDIWETAKDGLGKYVELKKYEKKLPNIHFSYWIEDTIISLLKHLFSLIFICEMTGDDICFSKTEEEPYDELNLKIAKSIFRKMNLENTNHLNEKLSMEYIKKVLTENKSKPKVLRKKDRRKKKKR